MKDTKKQNNQNKLRNKFLKAGVQMTAPDTIFFSNDTKIGKGVTIEPYVVIGSKVKIGNNVVIKSFSHLENCKIDSSKYSGLAFGLGIERIAMLKYGVNDIRDFYKSKPKGDLKRFIKTLRKDRNTANKGYKDKYLRESIVVSVHTRNIGG